MSLFVFLLRILPDFLGQRLSGNPVSIRIIGRDRFRYSENNRVMIFHAELLMGRPERRIYASSVKQWDAPFENELITDAQRRIIIERIYRYFEVRGISHEVVS